MRARSRSHRLSFFTQTITAVIGALLVVSMLPGTASAAPPATIQQMVDRAKPGATVTVPPGVYRETVYVGKALTLKGQPGAVIDGGSRAFWIVAVSDDVTIDGFEMRGGENWQYWGGITNSHNDRHYDRLTVRNSTLHTASYAAIATKLGTGHQIRNNTIHSNGALGIRIDSGSGHLISGNVLRNNNPDHAYDSGWEAGGIKLSGNYGGVHDTVVERNTVYGNTGPGIWVDVNGRDVTIRHNTIHNNSRSGITYELSTGGHIHDNRVWENGFGYHEWGWGAGILVQNSSDTRVTGNTVAWNADGISVISQDRGHEPWNRVTDNHVYENVIALVHDGSWNTYALAWLQDWDGGLTRPESGNRGWGNTYWLPSADGADPRFRWGDEFFHTLGDFQRTQGESNARYLGGSELHDVLSEASIDAPATRPADISIPDAGPPSTPADSGARLSGEPVYELSGVFLRFWEQNGGLPVFGYAMSDEVIERNADTGRDHTVQYLERQRFEHHPANAGTPYEVLLGRLGVTHAEQRGLLDTAPFQAAPSAPGDECLYFPETGHSLCGRFLTYWQSHGLDFGDAGTSQRESLALFGFPISEVFTDPLTGLETQFFERAVFEFHPNNAGTEYEVLLARLALE